VGLVHEDNVDWFLTLDETHHEFSTVGAKGDATARVLTGMGFNGGVMDDKPLRRRRWRCLRIMRQGFSTSLIIVA